VVEQRSPNALLEDTDLMHTTANSIAAAAMLAVITPAQSCPTSDEWPASASDGNRYGRAVDLDGGFLAIGDYSHNATTGRVYLRAWDGTAWTDPQILDGVGTGEGFGRNTSVSSGWIAIAAPYYNDGAVDLYSHDGALWNYEDSYETPAGFAMEHMTLSYPWLAVAESSDDFTSTRVQLLKHDAAENTWPVVETLDMPAESGAFVFVALGDDTLAVGLPSADIGATIDCGVVWYYELSEDVWTSLGYSTMNHADGIYGQFATIDATTNTLVFARHGDYLSSTYDDAVVVAKRFNGTFWDNEPLVGTLPWSEVGSQINFLAIDGDDLVVVLWNVILGEWSTHYMQRSGGSWYYQSELTPDDAETDRPRYVAAIEDGMLVMDGGTNSTERVAWVLPADDCDSTGKADACEVLLPGADGNGDSVLDRCMCPGDLNFDDDRNGDDIVAFLALWAGGTAAGDLDADGQVGVLDLLIILTEWGGCP
jgi:hypothetical protein